MAAPPASAIPGPLDEEISKTINDNDLVAVSVLSGNRNFEGRVNPDVRANYLASPPLVVAYSLLGKMTKDITTVPLGTGRDGQPVYLKDIWPTSPGSRRDVRSSINRRDVPLALWGRLQGRQALAGNQDRRRARPTSGIRPRPMCRTRPISRA